MRSGAVDSLNANGFNLRTITIELLTGETILISTEGKTTCRAIWNRVEGELKARGVVHPQIFGLAIKTGTEWVFVDPDAKIYKYFSKEWKSSAVSGLPNENKPLILYCRIHFYLETLPPNLDEVSILHYYLQVRQNLVLFRRVTSNLVQAVAYAYQSELGDWTPCQDSPRWAYGLTLVSGMPSSTVIASLTRTHQSLAGLERGAARQGFIRALTPTYNMHLYGMTLRTKDGKDTPAWIGVTPKGIEIYQTGGGRNEIPEQPKITFLWANITKLYFERKKFEIRGRACSCGGSNMEKLSFSGSSESVPKHLLLLCRTTHQFHLSNQKILLPNQSNSGDGKSTCSSTNTALSGIPSDTSCNSTLMSSKNEEKMLDLSLWADGLLLPNGNETSEHQRVSVISNASSNTTSGIVSDRVYSLDGSEEDLDMRASDCCTDQSHRTGTNNSTSLESLQNTKYSSHACRNLQMKPRHRGKLTGRKELGTNKYRDPADSTDGIEPKYWYCDSDCEDHCEDGRCKSLLVRTINTGGEKQPCSEHCECNSCLAEEDEFERLDLDSSCCSDSSNHHVYHTNTPSMASEKTLKAVDISEVEAKSDACKSPDLTVKDSKLSNSNEIKSTEHIYGEISEDPQPRPEYLPPENKVNSVQEEKEKPKPKPRCKNGPTNNTDKERRDIRKDKNIINGKYLNNCGHKRYKLLSNANNITVASMKETTIITPKVASLKCLRTQRVAPWSLIKTLKDPSNKSKQMSNDSLTDHNDETDSSGCYADFDKLQQGKYPSSRTVSDNFDTDSDYVQLPPLQPRPLPPKKPATKKLWKFVTNKSHHKSCGSVNFIPKYEEPLSAYNVTLNTQTLPRQRPPDTRTNLALNDSLNKLHLSKPFSRSTTVLNNVAQDDRPPEPPPKPRKLVPSSEMICSSKPVDARFITTKPQILIQTAYATPANVAAPSKAQVLFRGARIPTQARRTQSQIVSSPVKQSQSMDNIYDTVAAEDTLFANNSIKSLSPIPPPLLPKPRPQSTVVIRPNNYIDVHASSPSRVCGTVNHGNMKKRPVSTMVNPPSSHGPSPVVAMTRKSRCGSVPNNLHTFLVGLQNLKPLSRSPIVHPGATSSLALNNSGSHGKNHSVSTGPGNYRLENIQTKPTISYPYHNNGPQCGHTVTASHQTNFKSPITTVYTNQLSRSQIQQFKAQLYSDMDYVIFPPKDPRLSQQEYFDSKSLSYTTIPGTNSNPMLSQAFSLSANEIPPPYLPPPPPYPNQSSTSESMASQNMNAQHLAPKSKLRKPPKPLPSLPVNSATPQNPPGYNSYQSLYNPAMSSNTSQCSSSQYGYYGIGNFTGSYASSQGLNLENLQKFLSTQSLAGSHNNPSSPPTIYYPASTHSAPPMPYNKNGNQVLIENGMRKAVQKLIRNNFPDEESVRMKLLSRSEESLYSQPLQEETLQTIYNLPPPPPYKKKTTISPSEVDLATLRAKCNALEVPMLKALCSEGALLTQAKPDQQNPSIRPNKPLPNLDLIFPDQPPARPPKPPKLRQMQ